MKARDKVFQGLTVMITGAGGGFGAALAERFAAAGAQLVLSDLKGVDLSRTTSAEPLCATLDVRDDAAVKAHVAAGIARFGSLDIAINNAGIGQSLCPLQETDIAEFDRVMAVNARGVFSCMKHQLPGMIAARSGVIVNIASAAGLVGSGHLSAYAASKHAVVGLTKSAADEVARYGVRVNAVCPSFAPTALFNEMADEIAARHGVVREAAYERIASRIPMRRLARVDEVVQAVLWACDPDNSFMTGQAISIDGGLTAI